MKLSIIIPTYNSTTVIRRALDSIVRQSFTAWEVLVMDGASTDDTVAIVNSYQDTRIKVFSEPDGGIYVAMNKGILMSEGEWLYFLGSDDWLLNPSVLKDVFSQEINQYDVVYGDVEAEHLNHRHKGEWRIEDIEFNRCHQCIFYRRDIFNQLGLYNTDYRVLADYAFNIKWFFSRKTKIKYLPIMIAHFSDNGMSSSTEDKAFKNDFSKMLIKHGYHKLDTKTKLFHLRQIQAQEKKRSIRYVALSVWIMGLKLKKKGKQLF